MPEKVSCNLCGLNNYQLLHIRYFDDKIPITIVKCDNCGLIYTSPKLTKQEMEKLYKENYYYFRSNYTSTYENRDITKAQEIFNRIQKFKKKGSILDIGCGKGWLLRIAQENNWKTYGLEVSRYASNYARKKLGLNVLTGTIAEANFPSQYFDIITMLDVIEHLENPLNDLMKLNKILKKDGLLIIETPHIGSIYYKITRKYWVGFNIFHNYYFSLTTMKKILEKTGFKVIKAVTRPVNFFSTEGLWRLGIQDFILQTLDKFGKAKKIKESVKAVKSKVEISRSKFLLVVNRLNVLLNFPTNCLFAKFNMGDQLLIYAKREEAVEE